MKATGIVRRIDDLGRVVIPKEIRRTMRIREGDPLEIFVDRDGEVILKKYSPIVELGDFAQEYAEALNEATGHIALISDRDHIVSVAGAPKKEFYERRVWPALEEVMESRKGVIINNVGEQELCGECLYEGDECKFTAEIIEPIVSGGDPIGTVVITSKEPGVTLGEMEKKLAETAASFLAKQMEE